MESGSVDLSSQPVRFFDTFTHESGKVCVGILCYSPHPRSLKYTPILCASSHKALSARCSANYHMRYHTRVGLGQAPGHQGPHRQGPRAQAPRIRDCCAGALMPSRYLISPGLIRPGRPTSPVGGSTSIFAISYNFRIVTADDN